MCTDKSIKLLELSLLFPIFSLFFGGTEVVVLVFADDGDGELGFALFCSRSVQWGSFY